MPKRLIYEEDAIAKFEPWLKVEGYSEGELNMLKAVLYELRFLPTAQHERAIKDCRNCKFGDYNDHWNTNFCYCSGDCNNWDKWEPSAQPEIIRCNVCRHWHQTTGEMKGFGLGDCDYLEKKLVTCNGYCYWAERKDDE